MQGISLEAASSECDDGTLDTVTEVLTRFAAALPGTADQGGRSPS